MLESLVFAIVKAMIPELVRVIRGEKTAKEAQRAALIRAEGIVTQKTRDALIRESRKRR